MRQVKVEQVQKHKRRSRRLRRTLGAIVVVAIVVGVIALVSQHSKPTAFTAVAPTCLPKGVTVSKSRHANFTGMPPMCISAKATYDATVKTDLGSFVISMPASRSSKAVNNFVFLAGYRFFDGTKFFRAVPGTIVQGGSPTGKASGEAGYSWLSEPPKSSCAAKKSCYPTWSVLYATGGQEEAEREREPVLRRPPRRSEALVGEDPVFTSFGTVVSGRPVLEAIAKDGTAGGTPKKTHHIISVTITKVAC